MLNIKKLLTKIQTRLIPSNMFVVQTHESPEITTGGNYKRESTQTCTKSGYYPIGIVGYATVWVSGSTETMNYYTCKLTSQSNGSCTVSYAVKNQSTTAVTYKLQFCILWAKIDG